MVLILFQRSMETFLCQNQDLLQIIPIGKIRRRRKSLVLLILELMENSIEQASERE